MQRYEHRHSLPAGFIDTPATELHRLLSGPTLIDLPGERDDALFVCILQHGNEDSGLRAVQRLLADFTRRPLPRKLSLFIANVGAARHRRRRLDGQPDLNRCWPGTELVPGEATAMLAAITDIMRGRDLFASVDIHNTSGSNPVYACVNVLDDTCLQLARLFSRSVVYFTRPRGLQAQAFLGFCPAVVLECGRVGDLTGIERAHGYLDRLLRLDALPPGPPAADDIDLVRSIGLVVVPDGIRFRFSDDDPDTDLVLDPAIDRLNFVDLPAGTVLGRARPGPWPVRVVAPDGSEVTGEFFEVRDDELRLRVPAMPSLLTPDPRIVRQDCLCHLMERFRPTAIAAA